ncbi:HNH endonuclease [Paenibacillus sp. LBL]|uniref:HNH endonuclease n=1 Tax=Paenibacillus sp. LBL TaxID=2940563 RepID=UPI002473583F|nr:HNH endonuclease [Paenibacillus sp. LBL]
MRSKNRFFERDGYMVGVTKKGVEFLFDVDDFSLISQHTWCVSEVKGNRYIQTRIVRNGKETTIRIHRLILGPDNQLVVDHINHDCLDNRKENLRLCSHSKNIRNRTKRIAGTSKYKGVYFYKNLNKWKAQIEIKGKKKHLGYFENEQDAAVAYNKAAAFYFGEYAHLNHIA